VVVAIFKIKEHGAMVRSDDFVNFNRLHGDIDIVNQGDLQNMVESELVDRWLNSESERPCKQHKHTISSS
jgi:hypothetical protein